MTRVAIKRSETKGSLAKVALVRWADLEIATIFDGNNYNLKLDVFHAAAPERLVELLKAAGLPPHPMVTSVNAFLVKGGGRTMLVDTGMGHYSGPTMGYLVESLSLAGVDPEDVTDIVLTHLHRDHAGGLMGRRQEAVFTKATVHVSREEHEYWMDPELMARTEPQFHPFVEVAQTAINTYKGRVHVMDAVTRLTEQVSVSPIAGHTPGHTAVWFKGRKTSMCMWGDLVHSAALQCPVPEITVRFDIDEAQARKTRSELFARASSERFVVCGAHLPFPGVGWMTALSKHEYRFDPLTEA